jgi:hypothetical protein
MPGGVSLLPNPSTNLVSDRGGFMRKKKGFFAAILAVILSFSLVFGSMPVSAASTTLKKGMKGSAVTTLQKNLRKLGYFSGTPTGYFGNLTLKSVKKLQTRNKLKQDGRVGSNTQALIHNLLAKKGLSAKTAVAARTTSKTKVSRGAEDRSYYMVPWFGSAERIFQIGNTATILDISTGLSFKVKRTYGYNHADCEALTDDDTAIMKRVFGGSWSWERRAVIVSVNGRRIAASMAGMPHAGLDYAPGGTYVSGRSGSFGSGTNLDAVKGNNMNGHFDIHFYGSRTHGTNRVDAEHQSMVQKAADWAVRNY